MFGYINGFDFGEMEAMKYWAPPSSWTDIKKRENAHSRIFGGEWLGAEKKDGYFAKFSSEAGTNLKSPFDAGKTAADEFGKSVGSAMTKVYTNIQSNVQKSVTELDKIKQRYSFP